MTIEVLFLDNYGDIDSEISPVQLNSSTIDLYILVTGNFIRIEDKDYHIRAIRGVYEELELVKIEVKVFKAYVGQF